VEEAVLEYMNTKKKLMNSFNCSDDYFIKNLGEYNWTVKNDDGWYIVSFWEKKSNGNEIKTDVVVVKKNNEPQIFKSEDYTMIIGIQCVKIAFIFDNKKEIC
jgi:hypothetical protein